MLPNSLNTKPRKLQIQSTNTHVIGGIIFYLDMARERGAEHVHQPATPQHRQLASNSGDRQPRALGAVFEGEDGFNSDGAESEVELLDGAAAGEKVLYACVGVVAAVQIDLHEVWAVGSVGGEGLFDETAAEENPEVRDCLGRFDIFSLCRKKVWLPFDHIGPDRAGELTNSIRQEEVEDAKAAESLSHRPPSGSCPEIANVARVYVHDFCELIKLQRQQLANKAPRSCILLRKLGKERFELSRLLDGVGGDEIEKERKEDCDVKRLHGASLSIPPQGIHVVHPIIVLSTGKASQNGPLRDSGYMEGGLTPQGLHDNA
ncbi:hypothetical protein BDK51DRAFT_30158 [Blyttiomyces helicus]|uniref:Uncharacterized protein n=1 Tax=Blyttiomyces helicus TaxID=388810 RepID=A0A4P9W5E4_9FUNG|nr:hypothetical protein BDK51DRAFT_30158 [Blyttiomyces helicus]|eukprot:RKO87619.1 hypothetical protein BDK51DRAFT_30158 [Blyttiomyces helicus]